MGWLAISFGVTLIVLMVIHWQNHDYNHRKQPFDKWINKDDYLLGGIFSLFMSMIIVGMFGGMYSGINDGRDITAEGCMEVTNRWELVSAVRERNVQGSFILGTGGINIVDTYYAYQMETKGLMLTKYPTNSTYVVESDGEPRYDRIDIVCPMPVYDFLWWSSGNTHRNYGKTGTLYVPKNTILREFKL